MHHVPAGVVLVDPTGSPIEANEALQELLGYSEEELKGMPFSRHVHPDDLSRRGRSSYSWLRERSTTIWSTSGSGTGRTRPPYEDEGLSRSRSRRPPKAHNQLRGTCAGLCREDPRLVRLRGSSWRWLRWPFSNVPMRNLRIRLEPRSQATKHRLA